MKQFFLDKYRQAYNKLSEALQNNDFILFLIVINATLIFIQEFNIYDRSLTILENLFTILFMLEIYFKSKTRTFKVYISTAWNKLDFVLVAISLPSLITGFFIDLDFLLVFRIFRVFKFFRLLKYFPQIDSVVPGIKKAFRASYLIFFGFMTMLFIFSILSCAMFKRVSPEYFSTPIQSLFSTFQVFTVEGWNTIPDDIISKGNVGIGMFAKLYFAFLMFFGGIIGLSIVNSIFVDAMVSDNNDELQKKVEELTSEVKELKDIINDNLSNK
jgi:voltage-gated sodium channel